MTVSGWFKGNSAEKYWLLVICLALKQVKMKHIISAVVAVFPLYFLVVVSSYIITATELAVKFSLNSFQNANESKYFWFIFINFLFVPQNPKPTEETPTVI